MKVPSYLSRLKAKIEIEYAQRRAAHPDEVPQPRMLLSILGDDEFLTAKAERQRWIGEQGFGPYYFDELFDMDGNEIGRSYRFADPIQAFHFRMRF